MIGNEIKKAGTLPIAVLVLGDLAYANRNSKGKIIAPDYKQCFEEFINTWGKYKEYLLPVPGNHDYADDPTQAGIFKAYFADTLQKVHADPSAHFYVTRFPQGHATSWLLVGVNFYKDLKRQQAWLSTQLATQDPRCVLVFTHPFLHSSGHHGVKQTQGTMRLAAMEPFFQIAYNSGATVLVTAHDHDLEQFDRQDALGKASPQGVRSFVVGTGGAQLYKVSDKKTHALKKRHPLSQQFSDRSRGVLKLVLYRDRYAWSFLTVDGEPQVDLPVKAEGCNTRRAL